MKHVSLLALVCWLAAVVLPGCGSGAGANTAECDDWDVALIQGQRVGYSHTTARRANEGGKGVIKAAQTSRLSVKRFGDVTSVEVDYHDTETPDGTLLEFDLIEKMGITPMHTTGRVVGDHIEMQVETAGKTQKMSVAWPAGTGGMLAPVLSLRSAPLKAGQRRTVKHLMGGQIWTTELTARTEEPVELWGDTRRLLRIDSIERSDGAAARLSLPDIKTTAWTNSSGEILKSSLDQLGLNVTFYRANAEIALAPTAASMDIVKNTLIKVDRPIRRPHDTKWVRYRIHMDEGDPAAVFPIGPSQEVKRIDAGTAEVTVRAARPERGASAAAAKATGTSASDAPTDDDLKPNNFIQSDDPAIVAEAKEAVAGESDPWKQALALEAYVHRAVKVVDFTQAFATAAEVAKSRSGDCKGHAVYLAALARARKIPARVAVGLVYMPQSDTLGGHMWTEVYIGDRWIGLDATLGKGGIAGGHLKVADSSLSGPAPYEVVFTMLQLVGRLKIEVLDCE